MAPAHHDESQFQQRPDWSGWECCNFWESSPNIWCNEVAPVDQIQPDKFNYDRYRYQLYAKPAESGCREDYHVPRGGMTQFSASRQSQGHGVSLPAAVAPQGPGLYVPPLTDVRNLRQTMYVPILPTKPGGERDVTFPMTQRTMGQPDVTTACCVPVMPCQPGFRNLTPRILPGPNDILEGRDPNTAQCPFTAAVARNIQGRERSVAAPAHNLQGMGGYGGIPDSSMSAPCITQHPMLADKEEDDGSCAGYPQCVGANSINRDKRTRREIISIQETPEEREERLHTMFGHYGSNLESRPSNKRPLKSIKDNITQQGNGFQWDYPKHQNRLCYKLERNVR